MKSLISTLALTLIFTPLTGCLWHNGSDNSSSSGSSESVLFTVAASDIAGAPNEQLLTVTNTGTIPITSLSHSSLTNLTFTGGTCTTISLVNPLATGDTLAPSSSCTYIVQSSNDAPPGANTGSFTITGSDVGANPSTVTVNAEIDGYLYAGSNDAAPDGGVFRSNGGDWAAVGTNSPDQINDVAADSLGNIYTVSANADGAYKWDRANTWNSIGTGSVPPAPAALGFDSNANLYVGTFGFYELDSPYTGAWSVLSDGVPNIAQHAIIFDSSNNVYVGLNDDTADQDVQKWDGATFSLVGTNPPTNTFNLLFIGSTLYAAADGGVYSLSGTTWSPVGGGNPSPPFAKVLAVDSSNNLFAGFIDTVGEDVQKFTSGTWSVVGETPPSDVYGLIFDSNGVLYAGGNKGIFQLASPYTAAWTRFGTGTPPQNIYQIVLASTLTITVP